MSYLTNEIRPDAVMNAVKELTKGKSDMRVMRAEHSDRGWRLKYIALDSDYPTTPIERNLSRMLGEAVNMINLHYDFDTTARLICA